MQARCGCHAHAMHVSPDKSLSEQLDAELSQANAAGRPMRAIIVCNPNNPTGEVIASEVLQEYLEWCCEHDVHLVR
jgi:aspartate/methionine/tyrosine aminotransferase